jgi:predicted Zn-dependent peptidase
LAAIIPEIKTFKPVSFPKFSKTVLDNGIPVYQLVSSEYEVMKLEINFRAGRFFESQKGVARATANQLKEGTVTNPSDFMAELFDYHGASLHMNGGMDIARSELYTIKRYFKTLLPYFNDMLNNPLFSEKELSNYQQINVQRLSIDLAKNDILAFRILTELLYGSDHPYGYNSDKDTIMNIGATSLKDHFNNYYKNAIPGIILAGGVDEEILNLVNDTFGNIKFNLPEKPVRKIDPNKKDQFLRIEGQQKFQSSIRMGRRLFERSNPDYPGIYVLNAVLGGFFGSRLMQNIREDKGYTYDIYSTLDIMWNDGYMMIGADVDNDNIDIVIEEIKKELLDLQQNYVSEEELLLVKNYLNGNLLNLMNGPFNSIELMRLIAVYGYEMKFFDNFMRQLHDIDPVQLNLLAKKYLDPEDFTVVVAGK